MPTGDEIDHMQAKRYGFTNKGLSFIINYGIKCRMGQESGDEGEGEE